MAQHLSCPNSACLTYAHIEHATVIKHDKTLQGKQRYHCKTCSKTFNENKGTLFYRKQLHPASVDAAT